MNKMNLVKEMIFNYFAGNASPLHKKLIEDWLQEPKNIEQYFEWLDEWERTCPQFLPNVEIALLKNIERIDNIVSPINDVDVINPVYKKPKLNSWWIAAAVCLIFGVSGFLMKQEIMYQSYATDFGEIRKIHLPDGSDVTLNANSELFVPRWGFGTKTREVLLEGEAEFSVQHTLDHQKFIVNTPDKHQITVLGTEFVVYARQRGTKVVLNKGKVILSSANKREIITMKPGDMVNISKKGELKLQVLNKEKLSTQLSWKDHRFVFDNTPLKEIGSLIKENFGVEIKIQTPELANRTITGAFKAESAEELVNVLAEMLSFNVVKEENSYVISFDN